MGRCQFMICYSKLNFYDLKQDRRVVVHFQQCAWVDTKTAVNNAQAMKSDPVFVNKDTERVFLCDNLDAHKAVDFVNAMESLGSLVFFPPNVTDLLQPGKILSCTAH